MESTDPPLIAGKTCNVVRLFFLMLRKGVSKSKLLFDLMRRGKILREALHDLVVRHHTELGCGGSCRNDDVRSPGRRREYEFSCSDSPAFSGKSNKVRYPYSRYRQHLRARDGELYAPSLYRDGELSEAEVSPLVGPVGRLVRVTDSPFPLKDAADVDCHVDKAAEEFIERFYRQLRSQKWTAANTPVRDSVRRYG